MEQKWAWDTYEGTMRNLKKLAAIAAVPVAIAGWALFRPELLFINQTVNESLPTVAGNSVNEVSRGEFVSGAHETKGVASIVESGGKRYLRLSDFHTSNGPDVRVILLKKGASENTQGAIDLGTIKGNIGDQNYELPADVNAEDLATVSIWCQRFSVGFGTASLMAGDQDMAAEKSTSSLSVPSYASFSPTLVFNGPITVTSGTFKGDKRFVGTASIIEDAGKRNVRIDISKLPAGNFGIKLLKQESAKAGPLSTSIPSVDLGTLAKGRRTVSISKDLDLWLYRSIAITNGDKVIATSHLRSAQEKPGTDLLLA